MWTSSGLAKETWSTRPPLHHGDLETTQSHKKQNSSTSFTLREERKKHTERSWWSTSTTSGMRQQTAGEKNTKKQSVRKWTSTRDQDAVQRISTDRLFLDFYILLVVIKIFKQQGATNSTKGEQSWRELFFSALQTHARANACTHAHTHHLCANVAL